ncbi:hypothetical protein E2P81_ATG10611 [Venturia nashicola]|nr:hypothetical protein E2P81_ATG10611 [Venturia nashicola]
MAQTTTRLHLRRFGSALGPGSDTNYDISFEFNPAIRKLTIKSQLLFDTHFVTSNSRSEEEPTVVLLE